MSLRAAWIPMLCVLLAGTRTGLAQSEDAPQTPPEEIAPEPAAAEFERKPIPAPDLKLLAADALGRTVILWLREQIDPTKEDYRMAALGLRFVQQLRPDDEELLRLELQAWTASNDEARIQDATERLVKLNPRDTVAQLRLLVARLRNMQSVDERTATYERLLGPAGKNLDPSIRSRLALDAALLARESGDEDRFVERLTQATTLDITNKDAAALYATYFLDRTTDPRERVDLLANVVLSDPIDPGGHTNLARELFRRGAFTAASRFLDRAREINKSVGIEPNLEDLFDEYLLSWMTSGDEAALEKIQQLENEALSRLMQMRKQMQTQGMDPGELENPAIPVELELLRVAIAFGRGDNEQFADSLKKINQRISGQKAALDERRQPYDRVTDGEARLIALTQSINLLAARVWTGLEIEEASLQLEELMSVPEADNPLDPEALRRFRGLLAVQRGEIEAGREILTPIAATDRMARMGLALAAERSGDTREALRHYSKLALEFPHHGVGGAARRRIESITGKPVRPTAEAEALNAWSKTFAPWLDEMTKNPSVFMTLEASNETDRMNVFDRPVVLVTLRNSAKIPFALGPEHTFNSRLLVTARMIVRGDDLSQSVSPEAIELDRRLRVMPGEEVQARVWVGGGIYGMWLDRWCERPVTTRWRVIQGYRIDQNRRFSAGAVSVTAQTHLSLREGVPPASLDEIVEKLPKSEGVELLEWILRAMADSSTIIPREDRLAAIERRAKLASALATRVRTMSEFEKIYALAIVIRATLYDQDDSLFEAARDDSSPYVRIVLMLAALKDPDDPYLIRWSEDPDPELREFASLMRTHLARKREKAETEDQATTALDAPVPVREEVDPNEPAPDRTP